MTIEVELPNGEVVEFPDGTSTEVMERALAEYTESTARPSLRELNLRGDEPVPPTVVPGRRTAADVTATVHPRLLEAGAAATAGLAGAGLTASALFGGPVAATAKALSRHPWRTTGGTAAADQLLTGGSLRRWLQETFGGGGQR